VAVVVILVLAVLWAAVLLPPILRARAEGGGSGISGGIAEVMSTFSSLAARLRGDDPDLPPVSPQFGPVGQINGVGPGRKPGGMTPAQRRRRDVLVGLLCAAGITLVMALFSGGNVVFLALQVLSDLLLGAYVYLLLQFKSREQERRTKVRPLYGNGNGQLQPVAPLADPYSASDPALALHRTASY
jgi:hypothetical protein